MIGTARYWRVNKSNTARSRKVNRILLSSHLKLLNLNAKNSIRDTSRNENSRVMATSIAGSYSQRPTWLYSKGSEVMKIVLAGVFNPRKESRCVSSTLKIASRKAENTAMVNPI